MAADDEAPGFWTPTQRALQDADAPLVDRPRLTAKLLSRPPFRFLHDVVSAVRASGRWALRRDRRAAPVRIWTAPPPTRRYPAVPRPTSHATVHPPHTSQGHPPHALTTQVQSTTGFAAGLFEGPELDPHALQARRGAAGHAPPHGMRACATHAHAAIPHVRPRLRLCCVCGAASLDAPDCVAPSRPAQNIPPHTGQGSQGRVPHQTDSRAVPGPGRGRARQASQGAGACGPLPGCARVRSAPRLSAGRAAEHRMTVDSCPAAACAALLASSHSMPFGCDIRR